MFSRHALALLLTIGASLSACQTPAPPPPPPPPPVVEAPPVFTPPPPTRQEQPYYFRLPNAPAGMVPARVALLLPFSSPSAETRAVAQAIESAAELALFETGATNVLLMPRDDGGSPEKAAIAAAKAIDDGAEIIIGPLFAQSVTAVAPIARARDVPVIAFSTDRAVAGSGVYLLSFQVENEIERIISYAAKSGYRSLAALLPNSAYGTKAGDAFRQAAQAAGVAVTAVQNFIEQPEAVATPAQLAAQSGADAILIAEGGPMLRAMGPALSAGGATARRVRFLGTGLWDDMAAQREPVLTGGWYAAPAPEAWRNFSARYRAMFTAEPERIATLGYDAMSLVALLARGTPYARFTRAAITDPNGFKGVDGIFRFREDGSAERGLAILEIGGGTARVIDPAATTFQALGY